MSLWILLLNCLTFSYIICLFIFQDEHESMQEMDILDMNVLDETENDNGIPAEDYEDEAENFHSDENAMLNEEQNDRASEDEGRDPEVRN